MRDRRLLDSEAGTGGRGMIVARPGKEAGEEGGAVIGRSQTDPNFLYIGTDKAGSTWLYAVLSRHPEVYVAPGKGLYFFSSHYDRGVEWYRQQFSGANGRRAIGEISHDYLYSPNAPERIAALNPDMKLLVCLREPVSRAFSAYLHRVKNGELDVPFEDAITRVPSLVEHGRYHHYLRPYLERFGRDQIHIGNFDELRSAPDLFASRIFDFLQVGQWPLPHQLRKKLMPAGEPRSYAVAQAARRVARLAKRVGLRGTIGRAKRSPHIRSLLYREYTSAEKPKMRPETREELRRLYVPDIRLLDQVLGTDFQGSWGY